MEGVEESRSMKILKLIDELNEAIIDVVGMILSGVAALVLCAIIYWIISLL